ncbi:carbohydrate binding family 9 domain-containing protein [bacterium]|nr:carbohydrate binding family 9 domain-containing protein [bacterium]
MKRTDMKTLILTGIWIVIIGVVARDCLGSPLNVPSPQSDSIKTMIAVRVQSPPKIDGKLDDPCWKLAIPTSDFIQMDPEEGKPATEQTIVRVVYDQNNLYFGIECLDSRPDKVVARLVPRDSNFWPGDLISIALDTFHDHQNCFVFQVNPLGIQRDLRSEGDGRWGWGGTDVAWDGLWWSKGRVTDKGWTVEIAIPFKTLRFPRKKEQIWGVNIQRYQSSKKEDSDWSFISRDDGGVIKISKAGHLLGLEEITPGLHLELLPYGTTRQTRKPEESRWERDAGLDFKYALTSNLVLDATLNPDFAHIEADEERINLTRFELFYREKRSFFMERSELFTPMNLFYSRRIINPKFGAKFTGKLGDWGLGFLTAVDKEEGPDPTYAVLRLQKDILKNSSIGILAVGKQKTEEDYSRALGTDLDLRWEKTTAHLELAKSFNPGITKDDWRALVRVRRFTDRFSIGSELEELRPEFNVEATGYYPHDPHVGERRLNGWLGLRFYPKKFGIRRIGYYPGIYTVKRTDDPKWGWYWGNISLEFQQENFNGLWFNHQNFHLRWQGKSYYGQTLGLSYDIQGQGFIRRAIIGTWMGDQYDWGDQYFGKIRLISLWAETRPRDNLSLDVDGRVVWEYYRSGKLDETKKVVNFRVTYFPTRDLFIRVFLPVNPGTGMYTVNALLSWEYRPLSRFYIAFNERREKGMGLVDRIIVAKVSYLWNL